jgi:hypothetical protein
VFDVSVASSFSMRIVGLALRVIVAGAWALAQTAVAQTVDFNNNRNFPTPADRRVYNVDMQPLVGTNFLARLVYGPDASNLQPTGQAARFRTVAPSDPLAGTWSGGTRTLTGFSPGQTVTLVVQVWDVYSGPTYETASMRMQSAPFLYTIPLPGSAVTAYYIDNFRGIRPLSCPIPGPLAIAETNGRIQVSYQTSAGTLEISSDLATWSPVATTGSPYIDPTAGAVPRRFYRWNCFGSISRNYVGFYRMNFEPGFTLLANQLRATDDRVVALFPNPPSGASFYCGDYCSITYLSGAWEGDNVDLRLSLGQGLWFQTPVAFTQTFIGEVVLAFSNNIPAGGEYSPRGFRLVSSATPQSLPLTGAGGLAFPVAEGDEVFQFNPATGGYIANMFLGGAWEGDNDGDPPVPAVGECFFVRKVSSATWSQTINQYPPPGTAR